MTKNLQLAKGFTLPAEAITETFAILAKRGAGKSNTAVVMAEEMHAAGLPFVAIDPKGDWWGVRSSEDGKGPGLPIPVFGGLNGDVPLEDTAGAFVAELIAERRLTCIIDVSEFSKGQATRFLTDFAERLFRKNRDPLHVFLEEADDYIPQRVMKDQARLVGAWSKLVKQGRFRGLGITLITQRSAVVNKDVLTQIETLVAMRTTSPQDRKAVLGWVEYHDVGKDLVDSLPELDDGEAWVWSPHAFGVMERVKFRRRRTFDSGATPKHGKARAPATLAEIDLEAVEGEMAETIERAKAEDPKELRKEIRALKKQLASQEPEVVTETVEVPVVPTSVQKALLAVQSALQGAADAVSDALDVTAKEHETAAETRTRTTAPRRSPPTATKKPAPGPPPEDAPKLKAGARRILEVLARHHPLRLTKAQIGTLAKLKITGGTFQTYWGVLRRHELIDEGPEDVGITDDGLAVIGDVPAAPQTTDEIVAMWRSTLKAGARRMLDELVGAYPKGLSREELGARVDIEPSGGTFSTYLGTLRRNGLAEVDGDEVVAGEALFLGVHA